MIGRNIGNYVVLDKVGEGGMGAVYLAEHPLIGRQVAVKVLHPHLAKHQTVVARFFTEARSAYEVRSSNIVEILDFGMLEDKTTYFIMEWLDGHRLAEEMAEHERFPIDRAVHVGIGIGRALVAAHARGVVHRDLKPENVILVERDGDYDFVKVLDFGIAKLMDEEGEVGVAKGQNVVMGTPAYMSPEQCAGDLPKIDHRSDLYALGVMLYQMVAGRTPFGSEPIPEVLRAHLSKPPMPPSTFTPRLHPVVERVILRALEKDPARRYQSAEAMIEELQQSSPRRSTQEITHPVLPRMTTPLAGERTPPSRMGDAVSDPTLLAAGDATPVPPLLSATVELRPGGPVDAAAREARGVITSSPTIPFVPPVTLPPPAGAEKLATVLPDASEGPAMAAPIAESAQAMSPAASGGPAAAPTSPRFGPVALAIGVALGFVAGLLAALLVGR